MYSYTSFDTTLFNLVFVHLFFKDVCHDFTKLFSLFQPFDDEMYPWPNESPPKNETVSLYQQIGKKSSHRNSVGGSTLFL